MKAPMPTPKRAVGFWQLSFPVNFIWTFSFSWECCWIHNYIDPGAKPCTNSKILFAKRYEEFPNNASNKIKKH